MKKTYNPLRRKSESPVVDTTGIPDLARPEFKKDADINIIVNRMLAGTMPLPPAGTYGAVDYTADLEAQYATVQDLREKHSQLLAAEQIDIPFAEYLQVLASGEELPKADKPRAETSEPAEPAEPEKTPKASA